MQAECARPDSPGMAHYPAALFGLPPTQPTQPAAGCLRLLHTRWMSPPTIIGSAHFLSASRASLWGVWGERNRDTPAICSWNAARSRFHSRSHFLSAGCCTGPTLLQSSPLYRPLGSMGFWVGLVRSGLLPRPQVFDLGTGQQVAG